MVTSVLEHLLSEPETAKAVIPPPDVGTAEQHEEDEWLIVKDPEFNYKRFWPRELEWHDLATFDELPEWKDLQ